MGLDTNKERIIQEFSELTAIDALSFAERQMADLVKEKLTVLGFQVQEDQADEFYERECRQVCGQHHLSGDQGAGNIYGFLKGTLPGTPILLSAHLDTVQPGKGKKAVCHEDGTITSAGDTVLGADDMAGVTEILEGIRLVREAGLPHRDVEVLFSIAEEAYIKGTEVFDFSKIRAKEAYVLDLSGAPGIAALQAPTLISFQVQVTGRASHAGFAPEQGVNAIQIAALALAGLRQGRTDSESTLNIGTITGGKATNIVSDSCICTGEIRSYSHSRALELADTVELAFSEAAKAAGGESRMTRSVDLTAYKTEESAPAVRHFREACEQIGITPRLTRTFGGSDNNNFARRGITGIVLSCGMHEVHSVREYTTVQDLMQGARLVAHLIMMAK